MKVKLTKVFIENVPLVESGSIIYTDETLTGFALRVGSTGKRYILNKRINGKLHRDLVEEVHITSLTMARQKATIMMANIRKGLNPYEGLHDESVINDNDHSKIPTLNEAYQYFKDSKPELKAKTIIAYDRQILINLKDWLSLPLNDINKTMVSIKHKELSNHSKAQANATMRALRSVWTYARNSYLDDNEDYLIKEHPVVILNAKKDWNTVKPRTRHVEEEYLGSFFKTLIGYHDASSHMQAPHSNNTRDLLLLFLFTGVRLDEAQTLKWSDVDLKAGRILFRDTKNGSDYPLPMGDILTAILKQRKHYSDGKAWVFPSRLKGYDGPIRDLSKSYQALSKLTGYQIRPHDLRRTFGTVANSLNINYPVLKRLLNHREAKSTDDVTLQYVQVSQKQLREALSDIEKLYCKQAGMTQDEVIKKLMMYR